MAPGANRGAAPQREAQHSPCVFQAEPGHGPRPRASGRDACRNTPVTHSPSLPGRPGPGLSAGNGAEAPYRLVPVRARSLLRTGHHAIRV